MLPFYNSRSQNIFLKVHRSIVSIIPFVNYILLNFEYLFIIGFMQNSENIFAPQLYQRFHCSNKKTEQITKSIQFAQQLHVIQIIFHVEWHLISDFDS